MKCAVEMGSGAMIYTPGFIKIRSDIQKLMGGAQHGDLISLLLFFQNKEGRLKMDVKETGWEGVSWIHLALDRDRRRALVKSAMNAVETVDDEG
jgi:hypothetical protein